MKLAAVLLFCIVSSLLSISQALDDDEAPGDQKYTVSFFQFNPKDLAIGGFGGARHQNKRKEHSKRSDTDTLPKPTNTTLNKTTYNATVANATVSQSSANASVIKPQDGNTTSGITRDTDIMNTLIDMAIKKNTSHNGDISISGMFNSQNTTVMNPKINLSLKNGSSNATAKDTVATAAKKDGVASKTHKDILNPNPQPSENEALLNIKQPKQLEHEPHDPNIHSENTTKVTETDDKHAVTTNVVSMEKNNNELPEPEVKPETTSKNVTNDANSTSSEEEEKQRKIAKDKETNKEIKENAKEIKPIQNTVSKMNMTIHNPIKDDVKFVKESKDGRSKVDHVDETKIKHRNNVAKFVPLYKTSAKDHKLSFQIGAMKHPKHNIHPKCHACPTNSTYKECVKKSTLYECNQGLENICFTKSTKKEGIITYQMGCADHNKCVNAKAFPCKDGREHCFTCCQYDRCNSSPHHGDYELDELNLQELTDKMVPTETKDTTTLDSSSSATDIITGSWIACASSLTVFVLFNL